MNLIFPGMATSGGHGRVIKDPQLKNNNAADQSALTGARPVGGVENDTPDARNRVVRRNFCRKIYFAPAAAGAEAVFWKL